MDAITSALKDSASYSSIKTIYEDWDDENKALLLADLAIVHKHFDALRYIIDAEGIEIFYTPYDNAERITPFYIAELLCTLNKDYEVVREYIHNAKHKWGRKVGYLWVNKFSKEEEMKHVLQKLP
jgi:hypothetical protein